MEQERCEESIPDFTSGSIPPAMKKSSASFAALVQSMDIVEDQDSVSNLASPTPERTIQPSRSKKKGIALPVKVVKQLSKDFQNEDGITEGAAVELPDKYKTIAEFFDRIGSSVRLLSLRKKLPTFQNICTQVEVLTKRKLSYNHLAQIKYILPEAIQIEKILTHDEKTLCMEPDMKVTLLLDAVEANPEQSAFMALRQVFHARLLNFFNSHPEGCDIPEATLPEPFSQRNQAVLPEPLLVGSSIKSHPTSIEREPLSNSSHLSPSFSRRFSQKIIVPETEKTRLLASPVLLLPVNSGVETKQDIKCPQQKESSSLVSKSTSIESPAELIFSSQSFINSGACANSPVKDVSVSHQLMLETPVQPTPPRRQVPNSDDKINTKTRTSSHATAKKSLNFFSPLKGDESSSSSIIDESKQYRDNSLQTAATKRILLEDDVTSYPSALVQMVEENKDCMMSQIGLVERRQMLASLPELFNLIHHIFQSANCLPITKQELVHKIILNNCDIVEIREVEEQLELLEELVPDWICSRLVPSGDLCFSIRRVSDLESIRARLVKAV